MKIVLPTTRAALASWLFAGVIFIAILVATLTPGDGPIQPPSVCLICGSQGFADAICNIALYAPLGAALVFLGIRRRRAVLLAGALSLFIETMQATIVAGRDPSVGDVFFNTVGAAIGAVVAGAAWAWLAPAPRRRGALAGGSVLLACAVVATTGYMVGLAFEPTLWYGQWTANFGNMEVYHGRVLDARIGGRFVRSWRLDDNGAARQALANGEPLRLQVESSPITRRISAIFSVYDDRRSEQLLLGANGTALELFMRRHANDVRLINPPLVFQGALTGVTGGDTLNMEVRRAGVTWCAGKLPDPPCLGYTAGIGWNLLQDMGTMRRHAQLMNALWLFGLLVPAGFWLRGLIGVAGGAAAAVLVCALVPMGSGLLVSPPSEWLGAAGGLLAGNVLGILARQWFGDRAATSPATAASTLR